MTRAGGDATFADLAIQLVTSRQFRHRANRVDAAPATEGQPSSGADNNP
jgi:hypothetical protein